MKNSYPELRALLLREHETGGLRVVAAKTKLSEGLLRDIILEGIPIPDSIAEKVLKVMT